MRKSLSAPKSERKSHKRHHRIDDVFTSNKVLDAGDQFGSAMNYQNQMSSPFLQPLDNLNDLGKIQEASRDSENSCTLSKPRLTRDEQVVVKEGLHQTERNQREPRQSTGDYDKLFTRRSTGDFDQFQAQRGSADGESFKFTNLINDQNRQLSPNAITVEQFEE